MVAATWKSRAAPGAVVDRLWISILSPLTFRRHARIGIDRWHEQRIEGTFRHVACREC
jgi:hypothetical protein